MHRSGLLDIYTSYQLPSSTDSRILRLQSMGTKVVRRTFFLFQSHWLVQYIRNNAARVLTSGHQNMSMFLCFSMHSTGCQSVDELTTNFFHLFLFCDWLNRVSNTLLTSSVFMFLPNNSVSPLTLICFKSLLSKQVNWSTFFCLSRSYSLEQTPAQHPACVFHSLFQNCSTN